MREEVSRFLARASGRTELPSNHMKRQEEREERSQEFSSGHLECEMPVGTVRELRVEGLSLGNITTEGI